MTGLLLYLLAATAPAAPAWSLAVNPLAAATWAGRADSRLDTAVAANLEYGAAAALAYRPRPAWLAELRLSGGPINQVTGVRQAQLGLAAFPWHDDARASWVRGVYLGAAARWWRIEYHNPGTRYDHAGALAMAGYRRMVGGGVFVDLRLSQWIAVRANPGGAGGMAWLPSANPNFSPVLPMGLFEAGFAW